MCAHGQIPAAIIGKGCAFYRILLGHQHRGCVGPCKVRSGETMVIGQRMRRRIDPERAQLGEKTSGVSDAGNGVHTNARAPRCAACKASECARCLRHQRCIHTAECAGIRVIRNAPLPTSVLIGIGNECNHGVDASQSLRSFAQRSGGKRPAIAKAARGVDDRDLHIAPQRVMLQAVVADDDVARRMRGEQRTRRGDAIARRPTGKPVRARSSGSSPTRLHRHRA